MASHMNTNVCVFVCVWVWQTTDTPNSMSPLPLPLTLCGLICLTARQLKSWLPKIAAKLASAFAEATRGGKTQLVARTQYTTQQLHVEKEDVVEGDRERERWGKRETMRQIKKLKHFLVYERQSKSRKQMWLECIGIQPSWIWTTQIEYTIG